MRFRTVGLADAHSGYKIEFAYNYYESYLNARKNLTYSGQLLNKYLVRRFFSAVRQINNTCLSPVSRPRIKQLLENGTLVIVDRYAFSGVAFTAAKVGLYLLNFCLCLLTKVLSSLRSKRFCAVREQRITKCRKRRSSLFAPWKRLLRRLGAVKTVFILLVLPLDTYLRLVCK